MRQYVVLISILVILLTIGGLVTWAQEGGLLPTQCTCSDGQRLHYDPDMLYLLQVQGWQYIGLGWCYDECLRACGCDPYDGDVTCSRSCIVGIDPEPTDQQKADAGPDVTLAYSYTLAYNSPSYPEKDLPLPMREEAKGIAGHLNHFGPAVDVPLKLSFWVEEGPPGAYISAVESMTLGWDIFHSGKDVTALGTDPTTRPTEYAFSGIDWEQALLAARSGAPIAFESQLSVFTGYDGSRRLFEVFPLRGEVRFTGVEGLPPHLFMLERFFSLRPGPMAASKPGEGGSFGSAGGQNNLQAALTPIVSLDPRVKSLEATRAAQGLGRLDFNDYVCGGWQVRVLSLLDAFQSGDASERTALAAFDYGPIESRWGGHQAVVVYPKGKSWSDGIVLDPWPNQVPEAWSIHAWRQRFGVPPGTWGGVGPSSAYSSQYPMTGGTGYPAPDDDTGRPPIEHQEILRRLPPAVRQQTRQDYLDLSPADREAFIDKLLEEYPDIEKSISVAVQCPVLVLITDEKNRRVGWEDGETFVNEIPGAYFDEFPEADGTRGTAALLPLSNYEVRVTATESGSFQYFYGIPEAGFFTSQPTSVTPGEVFVHELNAAQPDASIVGPGGLAISVSAITLEALGIVIPDEGETAGSSGEDTRRAARLTAAGIAALVACTVLPIVALVGGGAVFWLRRRRSPAGRSGVAEQASALAPRAHICTACGRPMSPTARFCRSCGADIARAAARPARRHCRHCGQPAHPGARFCRHCGQQLS